MGEIETELAARSGSACADIVGQLRVAERRATVGRCRLSAAGMRCDGRGTIIERGMPSCPGFVSARTNLSLQRLTLMPAGTDADPGRAIKQRESLGYVATPIEPTGAALNYDCVAVPLAGAGQAALLIAARAMSAFSIVVIANSLRPDPPARPVLPPIAPAEIPA
jgi:cation transport ATPase